jgi:hypothetical protein
MPGLDPGICLQNVKRRTNGMPKQMAGSSPAMTNKGE